jgi:type 1 glutamine amidotransferase
MSLLSKIIVAFFAIVCLQITYAKAQKKKVAVVKPNVLIYSKTKGYRHNSIPEGIEAFQRLGIENDINIVVTEDSSMFVPDTLQRYAAVVFLNTTGNVLSTAQEDAFKNYINHGGGFMGVHAAADCEYGWPWYGQLVGAYFKSHPKQQNAKLNVVDRTNIATKQLPELWERYDEWYNYKSLEPDIHVLVKLDEKSYTGGENGDNHPISWYHDFDGGRSFYTGLGHTKESYKEPLLLKHLLGGLKYAIGKK